MYVHYELHLTRLLVDEFKIEERPSFEEIVRDFRSKLVIAEEFSRFDVKSMMDDEEDPSSPPRMFKDSFKDGWMARNGRQTVRAQDEIQLGSRL